MLLEKIVILGKLKILSNRHTSYDALSDHLTDKGALIALELLSDNEHTEKIGRRYEQITNNHLIRCNAQNCR